MRKVIYSIVLIVTLFHGEILYSQNADNSGKQSIEQKDSVLQLQEVVVKTERRISKGDTLIVIPTAIQKKYNINGFELVRSLMLPGINVDAISGSIATSIGQSVIMLLNGRPIERQDVLMVQPKNVIRIEYLQELPPEYAYNSNVGAVINIVTRPIETGYDIGLQANNALTVANGANIIYSKMYKRQSEFSISYANEYTSVKKRRIDNIDSYNMDNEWYTINRHGIDTPLKFMTNTIQLSYNYFIPQKHIFNVTINGSLYHSPDRNHKQWVTENDMDSYYQLSQPYEKNYDPNLNIYYKYFFSKKSALTVNAVGKFRHTDYRYRLVESFNKNMSEPFSIYQYTTKSNRQSYIGEIKYYNLFKTQIGLTAGARVSYAYTDNKYTTDIVSVDNVYDSNIYSYLAAYGYLLKNKLYYYLGGGFSGRLIKQNGISNNKWLFNPSLMLTYRLRKWNFTFSGKLSQNSPSISQLLDTEIKTNRLEIIKGNPNLKNWWSYSLSLRINANYGRLYFQNSLSYRQSFKPVFPCFSTESQLDDVLFVTSYSNGKNMSIVADNLNIQASICDNLQISLGAAFDSYYCSSSDFSNRLNTWKINASADWNYNNWSAGVNFQSKEKSLTGQMITTQGLSNSIYIAYVYGNLKFGLSGQYLFCKDGPTINEDLSSHYMTKNEHLIVPSLGNKIVFTIALSISGGKKREQVKIDMLNEDNETGILQY